LEICDGRRNIMADKLKQMHWKKILLMGGILLVAFVAGLCVQKPEGIKTTPLQPAEELKLSDFPEAFKDSTLIIVGDNTSDIEMQAVNEIAYYLENETGNKPLIKKHSEISDEDKRNYNLIVVGTPKTNPLLEEMYQMTDATRVTEEFPGEDKGVLEILRDPWNEEKAMLLVEGSDEWGVKAASILLNNQYSAYLEGKSVIEVGYMDFDEAARLNISLSDFSVFSSNVRRYFDDKYLMTGADYSIAYDLKDAKWLEENVPDARLIQAYARFRQPDITETFIFWNGKTYIMPDDFNKFVSDAHLQIINEDDALGIADVYIKAWEPSGSEGIPAAVILQSARDIPQKVNPVPEEVAQQIKSPVIKRQDNGFVVDLYSWCEIGGWVREWHITISPKGLVTAQSNVIGEYVGDCIIEV